MSTFFSDFTKQSSNTDFRTIVVHNGHFECPGTLVGSVLDY